MRNVRTLPFLQGSDIPRMRPVNHGAVHSLPWRLVSIVERLVRAVVRFSESNRGTSSGGIPGKAHRRGWRGGHRSYVSWLRHSVRGSRGRTLTASDVASPWLLTCCGLMRVRPVIIFCQNHYWSNARHSVFSCEAPSQVQSSRRGSNPIHFPAVLMFAGRAPSAVMRLGARRLVERGHCRRARRENNHETPRTTQGIKMSPIPRGRDSARRFGYDNNTEPLLF